MSTNSQAFHHNGMQYNVLSLSIPFNGCHECREEAYSQYEVAISKKSHDFVYFQDRVSDTYRGYEREKDREWEEE